MEVASIDWFACAHSRHSAMIQRTLLPQSDPLTPLPTPHGHGVASNDEHVFSQPCLTEFTLLNIL